MATYTTDADPMQVVWVLHARVWDLASRRGHDLMAGRWEVYTCAEHLRHHWHVLCSKRCRHCGQQASIERRIIAGDIHLRPIVPPGRCPGSLAAQIIHEGSPSPTLARLQHEALDRVLRDETQGEDR